MGLTLRMDLSLRTGLGRAGTSASIPAWFTAAKAAAGGTSPTVAIGVNAGQLFAALNGASVPVSSLVSVTRAQSFSSYVQNSNMTLTAFAANTLRYNDIDPVIEGPFTNNFNVPGDLSNAATSTFVNGSGSVTRTGASGVAPDGTNTATLVTINRSAGTDYAELFQTFTGTAASWVASVYIKANSSADIGKTISFGHYNGTSTLLKTVILTGGWQRLDKVSTLAASAGCQWLLGYVAGDGVGTGSASFQLWGGNNGLGTGVSSYVPAVGTRNADVVVETGALQAAYATGTFTQFARVSNMSAAGSSNRLGSGFNSSGGPTTAFAASATTINDYNGSSLGTAATIGNGVSLLNGPVNSVSSSSGTTITTVANGGTETSNALVMPAITAAWLGSDGGTASFLNGNIRLMVWNTVLTAPQRLALSQTFNQTSVSIGSDNAVYLVPTEASNNKIVMYFHGAGEVETAWTADTLKIGNREALLAKGYTLSATAAAGDNWGNNAGIAAYLAQYNDILTRYPAITQFYAFSQSMGGLAGLLTINAGTIPFRAWYGIFPVCNLTDIYAAGAGSFSGAINTAYGCNSGTFAALTAGHDPVQLNASAFGGLPMRFTASAGDTTVTKSTNAVQMQTLVSGVAAESYLLNTQGNHGDTSNFIPYDQVGFYERAAPISVGATGFLSKSTGTFSVQNLLLQSNTFANASWSKQGTNVAAPVVTASQTDPNSGLTASMVAFPAIAAANQNSYIWQNAGPNGGLFAHPFVDRVWMKGAVGGEVIWLSWTPDGVTYQRKQVTLTTSWQRVVLTRTGTGTSGNFIQIGRDGRDASQTWPLPAQTIYLWRSMTVRSPASAALTWADIDTTTTAAFATQTLTLPTGVAFRDFSSLTLISNPLINQNTQPPYDFNGVTTPIYTPAVKQGGTTYSIGAADATGWLFKNLMLYSWAGIGSPTKYASNPVLTAGSSTWDDHYLLHPTIFKPQGSANWVMYYSGMNATNHSSIGRATSPDMITWTKDGSNPILTGSSTAANVLDPSLPKVVQVGSQWFMYTSTNNNNGTFIIYWKSALNDGLTWTFGGVALNTAFGTDWDTGNSGLCDTYVFKNSHGFYEMAYTALAGGPQRIGYAVSADGETWYKYSDAPILTANSPQSPFNGDVGDVGFYQDGTTFYLMYDYSNNPTQTLNKVNLLSMTDH